MSKRRRAAQSKGKAGGSFAAGGLPVVPDHLAQLVNSWMLRSVGAGMSAWRKPGGMDFALLREVAARCEPVAAVVQTRQNQVAAFAHKAPDDKEPGWRIVTKDREKEVTARDKLRIRVVETFFEKMHAPVHPEVEHLLVRGKDYPDWSFESLLRAWVRDRLTLDAIAGEKVRRAGGNLFTLWPVDAATVTRAFAEERKRDGATDGLPATQADLYAATWMKDRKDAATVGADVEYIQHVEGRIAAGWAAKDFVYAYANPRTDINAYGYGYSELEMLAGIATAVLNAIAYNKAQFSTGSIPPGLLVLTGGWSQEMVEAFRRAFENQLQGPSAQNRLPILADPSQDGKGAQWVNMRGNNREMEYNGWLEFLVRIVCAIYQISPEEVEFKGIGGSQPSLFEKGPSAELAHSRDKGLKPLLRFLAGIITREIVEEFYDDLAFEFVNIDQEDEAATIDLATKRLQGGISTANEERAHLDMEKINESWADAPLNPVAFQAWSIEKQQSMQAQQQAQQFPPETPEEQAQGAQRFMYENEDEGQQGPPQGIPAPGQAEAFDAQREQAVQKSLAAVGASAGMDPDVLAASRFFGGDG